MRVLYTGAAGFIAGFTIPKLLERGHTVIGIDDFSKYGPATLPFQNHPNFSFRLTDLSLEENVADLAELIFVQGITHVVMGAAKIGGIGYFNRIPYTLQMQNDRINLNTIEAVLTATKEFETYMNPEPKVLYISSSMVFERATIFPTPEAAVSDMQVPLTNYGLQKLNGEFYMRGAAQEHKLQTLVIRPFNCVGRGEVPEMTQHGTIEYGVAHAIPDLVLKLMISSKTGSPLQILGDGQQQRAYTHGDDLAEAIITVLERGEVGEDYNACTDEYASVLDLVEIICQELDMEIPEIINKPAYDHDVQMRLGDSNKLKDLGWSAPTDLRTSIREVISFIEDRFGYFIQAYED